MIDERWLPLLVFLAVVFVGVLRIVEQAARRRAFRKSSSSAEGKP